MGTRPRQMSIGMNILGLGGHGAAWRTGESPYSALTDIEYFQNIARISERGTLDAIFLADGPALGEKIDHHPAGRLEPTILLTAVALATKHIGVIATASTTYNEPFKLARRERLTVRQLARRIRSGHRLAVGSPEQIADTLEEWFLAGAADGFNLIFVDHVVPILRRRGVFRTEYTGTTLRGHLGLSQPTSQYQEQQQKASA
jgi:alkanesulfonate monooxygenase SsuD/methylene tetrahydromethanopterin reductase-like flavin-dependent oxidoreductase (luciferase family)